MNNKTIFSLQLYGNEGIVTKSIPPCWEKSLGEALQNSGALMNALGKQVEL